MNKLLIFGVLFAMAIAFATTPLAQAADAGYGNASANATSMELSANGTIELLNFIGCTQTLSNSTNNVFLLGDGSSSTETNVSSAMQYNCTYLLHAEADTNISIFSFSARDNEMNFSDVKLYNSSNATSGVVNGIGTTSVVTFAYDSMILYNFTPTSDFLAAAGVAYNITVVFYTNESTISHLSHNEAGDAWQEKWYVNHPTSALNVTNMNLTFCPTYKTAFAADGSIVSLLRNGTSRTATKVGDCANITEDLNSSYEYFLTYRTATATGASSEEGTSATARPLAITEAEAAGIINMIIIIVFVAVIIVLGGVAVYLNSKKR